MKINKRNPQHWALLLQQGLYALVACLLRPLSRKPDKAIVVLYGHQLSGNLKALYDAATQDTDSKIDVYFLSLDPKNNTHLQAQGVKLLQCNRLQDMCLVGKSAAIITDHGLHAMSSLLYFTNIIFIDVWHGIPYKGFTPDTFRVQRQYHETWVTSDLLKTIYENNYGFSPEKIQVLGYARADKLFQQKAANPSYRAQEAISKDTRLVLYAPTWKQESQDRDLFPFGVDQAAFVSQLGQICTANNAVLVIRSHLNANITETAVPGVLYCPMSVFADAESLLQDTDVLICDWSSIAFDFLALQRPALFLDVTPPFANGFSLGPEYRYGEVIKDFEQLKRVLASTLQDTDGFLQERSENYWAITQAVYGESVDGKSAARQLDHLEDLISARH